MEKRKTKFPILKKRSPLIYGFRADACRQNYSFFFKSSPLPERISPRNGKNNRYRLRRFSKEKISGVKELNLNLFLSFFFFSFLFFSFLFVSFLFFFFFFFFSFHFILFHFFSLLFLSFFRWFSKEKILFKPRERSLAADIITKSAIPNISDSSLLLEEEGEEENRRKKHIDDIFSKRKKYLI